MKDNPLGEPEEWGVYVNGKFEWRVKVKPESGTRPGLHAEGQVPRAAVRLDSAGTYVNPFTGERGGRKIGAHLELEHNWQVGR